jgi:putative DNA primase/helicase
MSSATWLRVNRAKPCPVCGKDHACKVTADGAVAMCKRIAQGAFKESKGWYFHRLIEKRHSGNGQAHRTNSRLQAQQVRYAPKIYPDAQAAIDAAGRQCGGRFVNKWTYRNRDGDIVLRVIRYALPDGGKQYRPIHPSKDGWRIGDPSGPLPLYRLYKLPTDGLVCVTEGEKAADAARNIGLAATTSAHGSGSAEKTDWTPLAGREICILPDADDAGRKYAQDVARLLVKLEPPAHVKIVELPGLPEKGDIVEYIEPRRSQAPEKIRARIERLAAKATALAPEELIGGPMMVCMADVEAREVRWLWPGRIPLGRITLLVGRPGEGKSFFTMDAASRVSTGSPWPDDAPCERGSVLIISGEDDPADTIRPRLDAHHADVSCVHLLSMVRRIGENGKPFEVMFSLHDLHALEAALQRIPDCKLIVIDPIGSFLGGDIDAHRDNEVRSILAPVAKLAEKYGPAVLVVAHRRKSAGSIADDLALGSRAFTGIARAVWHLTRDSENKARRLLLPGKNNLAREGNGLAFTIARNPPAIVWEHDPVQMSADDALAIENDGGKDDAKPGPEPQARKAAEDWLRQLLASGETAAAKVKAEANAAGMNYRTVQRAADELGVKRERNSFDGGWQWRFPKLGAAANEGDKSA